MVIKYVKLASAATLVGLIAVTSTTMASDSCLRFNKQVNGNNQMAIAASVTGTLSKSYGNKYQLTVPTKKVENILGFGGQNGKRYAVRFGSDDFSKLSTYASNDGANVAISLRKNSEAYAFLVSKVKSTGAKTIYYLSQLPGIKTKSPSYKGAMDIYIPSYDTGLSWNCNTN